MPMGMNGDVNSYMYNPRLATGLGLSDGEGTERLWSRLIKLIGVERSSLVSSSYISKLIVLYPHCSESAAFG